MVAPARHEVAAEEVDKELPAGTALDDADGTRETPGISAEIIEVLNHKTESEDEEAPWTRLTQMANFSLGGFGFCKTRWGMGTYSRERKTTIPRQYATAKDALRGDGLRAPIVGRISRAAVALSRGTPNAGKHGDEFPTLRGRIPCSAETYEAFAPDGKQYEARDKSPQTIDAFARVAKQHTELRCLLFFLEPQQGRLDVIDVFRSIRAAQP